MTRPNFAGKVLCFLNRHHEEGHQPAEAEMEKRPKHKEEEGKAWEDRQREKLMLLFAITAGSRNLE